MRLAFWRPKDPGAWDAFRPLLLDQTGAAALTRLASERAEDGSAVERSPRQQKARGPSILSRARRFFLPLVMLAFGGLVTAGMAYGAWITVSDGDGLSRGDALRIAVIALLSLMFLGQVLGLLRMLPGASWLASRFQRPLPPPPLQLLLDQVSAVALNRGAPQDLGSMSRGGLLRSRGRRLADLGSWVLLVILALGVTLFIAAGSAFGAWSAFWQGGLGFAAVVQVAFLLLAGFGVFMLAVMGLRGLRQRRQRRRRRLLRRLLRFALRLFDTGRHLTGQAAGITGSRLYSSYLRHPSPFSRLSRLSGADFARALLLTAAVAGLAFYPAFADDDDAAGSGGSAGQQLSTNPGALGGNTPPGGGSPPSVVVSPEPPSPEPPSPEPEEQEDEEEEGGGPPAGPDNLAPNPPAITPIPCEAGVSQGNLQFGQDLTSLPLTLSLNDCGAPVDFLIGGSQGWITSNPAGGSLQPGGQQQINVFVNRSGLPPGDYSEQLLISSPLGNLAVPILVEVAPPCEIGAGSNSLDFGDTQTQLALTLSLNDCGEPVNFLVAGSESWISPNPTGGTLQPGAEQDITVLVERDGLPADDYTEQLVISSSLGNLAIPIFMEVEPPPCEIDVSPSALAFGTITGFESDQFEISLNDCGEDSTFDIRVSRGGTSWIFIDPARGTLGSGDSIDIQVEIDPGPMPTGPQSQTITITTDFGTFTVAVTACKPPAGGFCLSP